MGATHACWRARLLVLVGLRATHCQDNIVISTTIYWLGIGFLPLRTWFAEISGPCDVAGREVRSGENQADIQEIEIVDCVLLLV